MGLSYQQAASEDLVLAEFPAPVRRLMERITPESVTREMAETYQRPASERGVRRREVMTPEKWAAWHRYATRVGWIR